MKRTVSLVVVVSWFLLPACADSDGAGSGAGGGEFGGAGAFGEADVIAAFGTFRETGFVQITEAPAQSQHQLAPRAVVWIDEQAADAYRAIDPTDAGATAGPFPVGTIVIKESRTEAGEPDGSATVMAKLDEGFNPGAGDWWWGRFGKDGALVESGVLDFCVDCHTNNGFTDTDFVGGVAPDDQTDAGS
jgi:hypothetical protein